MTTGEFDHPLLPVPRHEGGLARKPAPVREHVAQGLPVHGLAAVDQDVAVVELSAFLDDHRDLAALPIPPRGHPRIEEPRAPVARRDPIPHEPQGPVAPTREAQLVPSFRRRQRGQHPVRSHPFGTLHANRSPRILGRGRGCEAGDAGGEDEDERGRSHDRGNGSPGRCTSGLPKAPTGPGRAGTVRRSVAEPVEEETTGVVALSPTGRRRRPPPAARPTAYSPFRRQARARRTKPRCRASFMTTAAEDQ